MFHDEKKEEALEGLLALNPKLGAPPVNTQIIENTLNREQTTFAEIVESPSLDIPTIDAGVSHAGDEPFKIDNKTIRNKDIFSNLDLFIYKKFDFNKPLSEMDGSSGQYNNVILIVFPYSEKCQVIKFYNHFVFHPSRTDRVPSMYTCRAKEIERLFYIVMIDGNTINEDCHSCKKDFNWLYNDSRQFPDEYLDSLKQTFSPKFRKKILNKFRDPFHGVESSEIGIEENISKNFTANESVPVNTDNNNDDNKPIETFSDTNKCAYDITKLIHDGKIFSKYGSNLTFNNVNIYLICYPIESERRDACVTLSGLSGLTNRPILYAFAKVEKKYLLFISENSVVHIEQTIKPSNRIFKFLPTDIKKANQKIEKLLKQMTKEDIQKLITLCTISQTPVTQDEQKKQNVEKNNTNSSRSSDSQNSREEDSEKFQRRASKKPRTNSYYNGSTNLNYTQNANSSNSSTIQNSLLAKSMDDFLRSVSASGLSIPRLSELNPTGFSSSPPAPKQ